MPFLGLAWLLAVVVGLGYLVNYQTTPGVAATPSVMWPEGSRVSPEPGRATLLMLAHPQCPCTRASIDELNSLLTHVQGKVQVYVLFLKPKGFPVDWEKTDLWKNAQSIPDVHAIVDEGGVEARRFHVSTSGQTLLFDKNRHLVFSGGITAGRGHEGENAGENAVISLINTGQASTHTTPVYGCSLLDPGAAIPAANVGSVVTQRAIGGN